MMEAFRDLIEPEAGSEEWNRLHAMRRLAASRTLDGTLRLDGLLAPEGGEQFLGTLGQLEHLLYEQDQADGVERSAAQRRADALNWRIEMTDGRPSFFRPDGTLIEPRPPPPDLLAA